MTVIEIAETLPARIRVRPRAVAGPPPTVTVVVSCFNYGRYLPQAVRSALSQQGVDVDVLIVDDASTDDSLAVALDLERRFDSVSVIASPVNRGVVDTFNDGASRATGEFLVRLDADDLLAPGALVRATQLARAYPTVGLVYGHPLHFSGGVVPRARTRVTGWTVWPGQAWLADRCRSGKNVITSPEVLMRTSVVRQIGPQAPLPHTHDMEYWLRLAAFSDVAYVHGADQAWHREHEASLSAREVTGDVDLRERHDAFTTLFSGPAHRLPAASELAAVARSALVADALRAARHELDRGVRESTLLRACRNFAAEHGAGDTVARAVRRVDRRIARGPAPVLSRGAFAVRRLTGRVQRYARTQNWHRNGVY